MSISEKSCPAVRPILSRANSDCRYVFVCFAVTTGNVSASTISHPRPYTSCTFAVTVGKASVHADLTSTTRYPFALIANSPSPPPKLQLASTQHRSHTLLCPVSRRSSSQVVLLPATSAVCQQAVQQATPKIRNCVFAGDSGSPAIARCPVEKQKLCVCHSLRQTINNHAEKHNPHFCRRRRQFVDCCYLRYMRCDQHMRLSLFVAKKTVCSCSGSSILALHEVSRGVRLRRRRANVEVYE